MPAATPKVLDRRLRDFAFERHVSEPRDALKITYKLPTALSVLVVGLMTAAQSLRHVEQRSGQLVERFGRWHGLMSRIADNTLGKLIPRLSAGELVSSLVAMVKAEHRRGNLVPTGRKTVGNRYYVTRKTASELPAADVLSVSRDPGGARRSPTKPPMSSFRRTDGVFRGRVSRCLRGVRLAEGRV